MNQEMELITTPEELFLWMKEQEQFFDMTEGDAELLLQYTEEMGRAVGTNKEGELLWINMAADNCPGIVTTMDDVIGEVCEYNYEQIERAEEQLHSPRAGSEYEAAKERLGSLKEQEKRLDRLFDQTHYGKRIDSIAQKWADELIAAAARGGTEGVGKLMEGAFRELDEGRAR